MLTSCLIIIKKIVRFYFTAKFLKTDIKNSSQPAIKQMPPSGVIAPIHLIPDIARIYKLPENSTIPANRKRADQFSKLVGIETESTPISSKPNA